MNLMFNYLYRDAGNYKTHGFVIFSNPNQWSIELVEKRLKNLLIDSQFFDPIDMNVPCLKHEEFEHDPELDHFWNKFESFEITENRTTDKRTITEFFEQLEVKRLTRLVDT